MRELFHAFARCNNSITFKNYEVDFWINFSSTLSRINFILPLNEFLLQKFFIFYEKFLFKLSENKSLTSKGIFFFFSFFFIFFSKKLLCNKFSFFLHNYISFLFCSLEKMHETQRALLILFLLFFFGERKIAFSSFLLFFCSFSFFSQQNNPLSQLK